MTRLVSQYEVSFGVNEEDEATRLYSTYGWIRACQLVQIFEATSPRVYRAFWFRVACQLADKPDGLGLLPKEREAKTVKSPKKLSITVAGVSISRTQFFTWLRSKGEVLRS